MTDGGSDSIEEKRVYGERRGKREVLVAAEVGIVAASVANGRVGEFGVEHRCSPRDVAASEGRVAVATPDDVLLDDGDGVDGTGFGPAVAVGVLDGTAIGAAPDGRVARLVEEWETVGVVEAGINAISTELVAADDGVHRIGDGLSYAGLSMVRDVSATGVPLAATADGLYALGNGWMDVLEGDFHAVASDGERAHAATGAELYERREDDWRAVSLPVDEPVVDVAYAGCPYAVTADGTLLAEPEDEDWRSHPLGVSGVVGLAVP